MSKGVPITEQEYYQIRGALASGLAHKEIERKLGVSSHTIKRAEEARTYQEYDVMRKERTQAKREQPQANGWKQETMADIEIRQNIQDIARAVLCIKQMLSDMLDNKKEN